MIYERNKECECAGLPSYGDYRWSNGYIYNKNKCRECKCHKDWRISSTIENIIKDAHTSWDLESIDNYVYKGEKVNMYKKFTESLPKSIKKVNSILYMAGPSGSQKTVTALKCFAEVIRNGYSASYWTMNNLLDEMSKLKSFSTDRDEAISIEETYKSLFSKDLIIIDNMFEIGAGSNIGNWPATVISKFEDLITSRKGATILISQTLNENEKVVSKVFTNRILANINRNHTYFEFTDVPAAMDIKSALDDGSFWDNLE